MRIDLHSLLATRLSILKALFTDATLISNESIVNYLFSVIRKSVPLLVDTDEDKEFIVTFDLMVVQILMNNYSATNGLSDKLRTFPQCAMAKDIIDRSILFERKLELTNHGCQRSFKFWSEEKKLAYLAFGNEIIKLFRKNALDSCFGFGTVLGLHRNGKLIDHDDDIDILVTSREERFDCISSIIDQACYILQRAGYTINLRSNLSHIHIAFDHETKIDVFAGLVEGEYFSCCPHPRKFIRYDEIFPASARTFFGMECLLPRHTETYLAKCYGENWRTPVSIWRYDWGALQNDYKDILMPCAELA